MPPDPTPLEMLLIIAVGALIAETPARRRQGVLRRISRSVGDPRIVPIHDGDDLKMSIELRALYERLLPSWTA
jgi:hypothetical protein